MLQNYLCNVSQSFGHQIYFVCHSESKSGKQVSQGQAVRPSHPAETCELLIECSVNIVGAYEIFSSLTELLNEINLLSSTLPIIFILCFPWNFKCELKPPASQESEGCVALITLSPGIIGKFSRRGSQGLYCGLGSYLLR